MSSINDKKITEKTLEVMIQPWAQISILGKVCACTASEGVCPFGDNLKCLQTDFLQIRNTPHNCVEPLTKLCLESIKTVWEVAEIYAEDISLIDIPSPALRRFLDTEKARQSQK